MHQRAQRIIALTLAATIAGLSLLASPAQAATYAELQQQVEEATAAYDEALSNVERIQGEIDENEARISEIEQELPERRGRAGASVRALYKMQQGSGGLIDLVLSSEDFSSFVATIAYLDRIQERHLSEIESLTSLNSELQETRELLGAQKGEAEQEAERAKDAQTEAIAAREAVRQQAIAQAAAEQAAAQAAIEEASKAANAGETFTNASGQQAPVSVPTDTSTPAESVEEEPATQDEPEETPAEQPAQQEPAEQPSQTTTVTSERDAFVSKWAGRIDAYLAGSALSGYGSTFAEAAWDYNVDPRWSPAISCIESSKGAACFLPHNAWGWGSSSWGDWDSAIRGHVAGLSAGYGYTISPSAAQRYCPPTWQHWYSSVLSEMNSI